MRRFKSINKNNKNTIFKTLSIVFFCVIICSVTLFNVYGNKNSDNIKELINAKIDKFLYQYFNEKINEDIVDMETRDLLNISRNKKDEIISVDYDLKNSYKILSEISTILKKSINNLENGMINVSLYDKYLMSSKSGLIMNIPIFLSSNNVFLNNIGPKIPVIINFNETLLTNIKTKVTNYGFNNALLEIYVTVEMEKLIITPINKDDTSFKYDILIGAKVVHGSVPEFYGNSYEIGSDIFNIPMH